MWQSDGRIPVKDMWQAPASDLAAGCLFRAPQPLQAKLRPAQQWAGFLARAVAVAVANNHGCRTPPRQVEDSYLVDSASSHMLVSKIKPCMSKYKQLYGETANGSLYQLSFI